MFPTAIKKDIERVEEVIEDLFVIPWENDELVSLSTGIIAHPQLIADGQLNRRRTFLIP